MDIKQEIEQLKAKQMEITNKLAELEAEANGPLDCYFGEGYSIACEGGMESWDEAYSNDDYTIIRHKEIAEQAAPLVQIQRALMNFKCEHDPVFDKYCHYTICGQMEGDYFDAKDCVLSAVRSVAFSSRELAQAAMDMLKRRGLV